MSTVTVPQAVDHDPDSLSLPDPAGIYLVSAARYIRHAKAAAVFLLVALNIWPIALPSGDWILTLVPALIASWYGLKALLSRLYPTYYSDAVQWAVAAAEALALTI